MSDRAFYLWIVVLVAVLVVGVALMLAYKYHLAVTLAPQTSPLRPEQVHTPEQTDRAEFLQQAASATTSATPTQTDRTQFLRSAAPVQAGTSSPTTGTGLTQDDRESFLKSLQKQ